MGKVHYKVGEKVLLPSRFAGVADEFVTISPWTKVSGPRMQDWYVIKFSDGGKLLSHATSMQKVAA